MKFSSDFTIETPRCILRYPSLTDIPFIFKAAKAPGFTDGMQWEPPLTEDELIPNYETNSKSWKEDQAYCFTITCKETRNFLGRIAIRKQHQQGIWDLGFFTHPDHYNKGLMKEVVKEVIRFGFEQLAATQIIADHALWNKASEAVLKSNHMKFLQHLPQGFMKHDKWVEENQLGITKQEWTSSQ
jgi:[ribosomal protein S5]-alanine N-acetyltransferase